MAGVLSIENSSYKPTSKSLPPFPHPLSEQEQEEGERKVQRGQAPNIRHAAS